MIAYTSSVAHQILIQDVERHEGQKSAVYRFIRDWNDYPGPSREDVARGTGLRLASVCGRVKELIDSGIIEKSFFKEQEVVPGKPLKVETLRAIAYKPMDLKQSPQLDLFERAA